MILTHDRQLAEFFMSGRLMNQFCLNYLPQLSTAFYQNFIHVAVLLDRLSRAETNYSENETNLLVRLARSRKQIRPKDQVILTKKP